MNIEEYSDLTGMGFEGKDPIAPEDEFFHSVYISGQSRKNHIGELEQTGKLQIRGVDYNLDEVYGIIVHIKSVLIKSVQKQGRESTECFSWCDEIPPWKSTSGRMCGKTAADRASIEYCGPCRSQIIVAFIRCNPDGSLYVTPDKKPIFMFIRGKGVKYSNVYSYVNELSKLDLEPIFTPQTPETTKFEKTKVNHKRFVTKISIGSAKTNYGNKSVFELTRGADVPVSQIQSLLKAAKNTLSKFKDKFDWSKATDGKYSGFSESKKDDSNSFGDVGNTTAKKEASPEKEVPPQNWNFDDISF